MSSISVATSRHGRKYIPRGQDYQTWELGLEHIQVEGSSAWQKIRERHGLTPEDLESLASGNEPGATYSAAGYVFWEEVRLAEDRPGLPKLAHLCLLALLEGVTPGALLDRVLVEQGRKLEGDQ